MKVIKKEIIKMTPQQQEVIYSKADVKRVIACAGSGKTLVLTRNIINLLKEKSCTPDQILAITFTRNAAGNMRQNIKEHISSKIDLDAIDIYTFNSFGNLIISDNSFAIGLGKNYRLINASKSWQILFDIIKYADLKNIVIGKDTSKFVEKTLHYISGLKSNLISPEELIDYYKNHKSLLSSFSSKALKKEEEQLCEYLDDLSFIYKKYEKVKLKNNFIDYNDHVFLPYKLMKENKAILEKYKSRYKYIFIDEFQDTDIAQGYLISLLYKPGHNNLMVVGDDDQGIYSFRGACIENIINFSRWKVFSKTKVKDFFLTTNFRSGTKIINNINSVISSNANRSIKDFKAADKDRYSEVIFFKGDTHEEECSKIVCTIKVLLKKGLKLRDIAILSRVKRFKSICSTLDKYGLKYEVISSRSFFFEPEILFLVSWLVVIKHFEDEVHLLYLLQSSKYRISDRDIFFLKNFKTKSDKTIGPGKNAKALLINGILDYSSNTFLGSNTKKRLEQFLNDLNYYIKQSSFLRLAELIDLIFKHSGLKDELKSDFDISSKSRIKNIERMIRIGADFESEEIDNDLDSFIVYLKDIAKTEEDNPEKIEFSRGNSIKIMSIHAAKGLEFEAVFLPMLWKKDYSGRRANSSKLKIPSLLRKDNEIYRKKGSFTSKKTFDREIKKLHMEEERRIFYVGCSRAKSHLFLSYSRFEKSGYLKKNNASENEILPFLIDVFRCNDIKALDHKSRDFVENIYSNDLSIGVCENRKSYPVLQDIEKNDVNNRYSVDQVFSLEDAYRAERKLISLMRNVELKETNKEYDIGKDIFLHNNREADFYRNKKNFSLTELLDYINCPMHYKWRYFYNIPDIASEQVRTGERVHEYIYALTSIKYRGIVNNVFTDFDSTIKTGNYISNKTDKLFTSNYIDNFKSSRFFNSGGLRKIFLEQLFYWHIDGFIITCKVDRMDIKSDNSIRIIDYKVTDLIGMVPKKSYINQLKAYIAGISDIFNTPTDNIRGFLFFLGNNKEHELSFSNSQLKNFKNSIKKAIGKINDLDFRFNRNSCIGKKCPYFKICEP